MTLSDIKSPADIKSLSYDELDSLATQLREALLKKLSVHGGHIGPNLGVVELTLAMHYVFNSPVDKIVYDVSHQSYVHKMLTGRMDAFTDPAKYDDVSGYTNPDESPHDFFTIGHTSTAVSLASGMALARDLKNEHWNMIAVVGDGSLSGGEAFEGLDFGATLDSNFIVIVNDNDMSIAENHGGIYANLRELRETEGQAANNYFKTLGYDYVYVGYGNDIRHLVEALRSVKDSRHPVVVHVNTMKGMGYAPAERDKEHFHWNMPFDLATGAPLSIDDTPDYSDLFRDTILDRLEENPLLAVVTAATPGSFGFTPESRRKAGNRFIDVGICEQEAVALCSGMAKEGMRPVFGVVSSFLQRTYDQLSQDVAINRTSPVINIFYGSVMGMNDVTHLGWFDIALVSNIPEWVFLAPTCAEEYLSMLDWSIHQTEHPVAIRVPGGPVRHSDRKFPADYSDLNRYEVVKRGKDVALISEGPMFYTALDVAETLREKGIDATVINPRFLSGVDSELLDELRVNHWLTVSIEDGVLDGGFGEKIARYYGDSDMKVSCYGVKKEFADRVAPGEILRRNRLTAPQISEDILALAQKH